MTERVSLWVAGLQSEVDTQHILAFVSSVGYQL